MNKYKVVYWYGGNKLVAEVKGEGVTEALYNFYMNNSCDDIISLALVSNEVS